jgi:hypothetical protein
MLQRPLRGSIVPLALYATRVNAQRIELGATRGDCVAGLPPDRRCPAARSTPPHLEWLAVVEAVAAVETVEENAPGPVWLRHR